MTPPASNPYIVVVPTSPVPTSWRGPRPWVRVADLEMCGWTDDGWQRRSVDGSVWAGLTIRAGTVCDAPDRLHSMAFEEDEQGAFDICEDCGWASELPTTAEVAAAEERGEFWY